MSGSSGHWGPEEDDALHGLPWGAQLLYLRGMRRFMSRDGVVGRARRISERGLIETFIVPGRRGRHRSDERAPTRHTVRHLLAVLRRAGLIEPLGGAAGRLVFRLPLAPAGQIRPEDERTMSAHHERTDGRADERTRERQQRRGFVGMSAPMDAPMSAPPNLPMSAPHQITEVITSSTPACSTSNARARDATAIGELCKRLRLEAHMLDAHPGRSELVDVLAEGIEADALVATALEIAERRGVPNVGYLVSTVRGRMRDAATAVGSGGRGAPRMSVCDLIEQQDQRETERERNHLAIVR